MSVDFTKFCDHHGGSLRYEIDRPFVQKGYEWATDLRILVRRLSDQPDSAPNGKLDHWKSPIKFPNCVGLFSETWKATPHEMATMFVALPEKTWNEVECWACNETGKCHCPACYGVNEDLYELPLCECCQGSGSVYFPRTTKVGVALVDVKYDKLIRELPGLRVRIPVDGEEEKPICFVFDGGEGLLMPMRDE